MAKVKFTSVVSEIRGKLRGDVFKGYLTGFALQDKSTIPRRQSEAQMLTRSNVAHFASNWSRLSPTIQALWESYARGLDPPRSGQSVYVGHNVALATARHPALGPVTYPPIAPGIPPVAPISLCLPLKDDLDFATTVPATTQLFLFWPLPISENIYCKLHEAKLVGTRRRFRERWNWAATLSAETQFLLHPVTELQQYKRRFRTQSIDTCGRTTPLPITEPDYFRSYHLEDLCDVIDPLWSAVPNPLEVNVPPLMGDQCFLCRSLPEELEMAAEKKYEAPMDWTLYKYFHFFFRSPKDPGEPRIIETTFKIYDDVLGVSTWNFVWHQWGWNHICIDLAHPDFQSVGFHWNKVDRLHWYAGWQEPMAPWYFELDYCFQEK